MKRFIDAVLIKGLPAADIKNANKVNLWAFLWAGSLVATVLMQEASIIQNPIITFIAFTINLTIGVIMALSYKRMLRKLDEMERKIQYGAMTLAVAMSMLVYGASSILHTANLTPELDSSWMLTIMAFSYSGGLIVGRVRMA